MESGRTLPSAILPVIPQDTGLYDDEALEFFNTIMKESRPRLREIKRAICEFYAIEAEEIEGETRNCFIVRARQIFCYLAHRHTRASFSAIGLRINRDHSTVHHACRQIGTRLTKGELREDLNLIQAKIIERILLRQHRMRKDCDASHPQ